MGQSTRGPSIEAIILLNLLTVLVLRLVTNTTFHFPTISQSMMEVQTIYHILDFKVRNILPTIPRTKDLRQSAPLNYQCQHKMSTMIGQKFLVSGKSMKKSQRQINIYFL